MEKISFYIAKAIKLLLRPAAIRSSQIDRTAKICSGSQINNTIVGKYSYIGNDCFSCYVKIGNFCSIADNCRLGGETHPMEWVSMSPVFMGGKNVLNKHFSSHCYKVTAETIIGNDVWIGVGVQLKSGVCIGDGAVIGMGSIVTKDIPPYAVAVGNPARVIRYRFDDGTVTALLKTQWWDWETSKIAEYSSFFNTPEQFLFNIRSTNT